MIFNGIITALITPFDNDQIDFNSFKKIIEKQIDSGISSIVIGGSTGEGSSLSDEEYYELIEHAVKFSAGRINVIAGMTGVNTKHVCKKIERLTSMRVDGLMCTVPHYVKPEQHGLIQHFEALNDASSVPIMLYAHPGRTGCSMSDEVIIKLSKLKNITAIKDASGDVETPLRLLDKVDNGFNFLVGDDSMILAYSANGGQGCVSVISNVMPKSMVKINDLLKEQKFSQARLILQKMMPIISVISLESNPIVIKCLAQELHMAGPEIRLPLTVALRKTRSAVRDIIVALNEMEK